MNAILALDIGNTHTDAALFAADRLQRRWHWPTPTDAADIGHLLQTQIPAPPSVPIVLTTVVPRLGTDWPKALPTAHVVSAAANLGYSLERVATPDQLGTDRLCACAAAVARWGAPVIVIDSGTAATLSLIDAAGRFIGGAIMPGLTSGLQGLIAAAPRLPWPDLQQPATGVGLSTVDAVRFGTLRGHAGALQALIDAGLASVGPAPVVGTGGSLPLVASWLQGLTAIEPDLVLWGAYEIGKREGWGG